jgi:hypothetical protein
MPCLPAAPLPPSGGSPGVNFFCPTLFKPAFTQLLANRFQLFLTVRCIFNSPRRFS